MNALLTLAAGIMGWRIAARLKLPAPAMLGSMIAVGLTNILFDYAALPLAVKVFAQAISGAFIGMQINRSDLGRLKSLIIRLILAVLLTANTFVVGIVIRQLAAGTDDGAAGLWPAGDLIFR
ncbi:MAG: AbrB family transcriptional regulator [Holdemania massiliensis]